MASVEKAKHAVQCGGDLFNNYKIEFDVWFGVLVNFQFNNANADVFIGTNAGRMVYDAILNAKKRVFVMSPYLDIYMINLMNEIHSRGIKVNWITMEDSLENRKANEIAHSAIFQNKKVNKNRANIFLTAKIVKFTFLGIGIFLAVAALIFSLSLSSFHGHMLTPITALKKAFVFKPTIFLYGAVSCIFIFFIIDRIFKNFRIYQYSYSTKFPMKFIFSPYFRRDYDLTFFHAKIFLVDDIVFTGSLNFTNRGFKDNFETRLTIKDQSFTTYIENIFTSVIGLDIFVNLDSIGKRFYQERPN